MRLLACSVMLICSLALVNSYPVEQSSSAVQNVEGNAGSQRELVRDKRTIGILRDLFPNFSQDDDNKVETKERKKRQAETELKGEAVSDNNEVSEESSLEDDEDRDKRFLSLNGGATASGNSAGSGNFLFDVIRRSADRAARMAGTVYRVLAGTDDLGLASFPSSPLVAGSGNTEETDEASNTPLEGAGSENHEQSKGYDGLGVPGPLTRLFVIANRGVASLIQDLILRLAQTSEKLVNFKARLITSII